MGPDRAQRRRPGEPPKGPRYEVEPLGPNEVRRLLEAVRDDRLEALYVLAVTLGLRQGELLGLSRADIDLGAGSLRVHHALQRFEHEYHLVEPKSARSRRTVMLPSVARSALERHHVRQQGERARAGELWQEHGLVFTTATGQPLDATGVTSALQRHLLRAGLRRQRFHDLRNACASLLLSRGVSPRAVMELLGHSRISLTMDTYSHVLPNLLSDAATQMDQLLTGDAAASVPVAGPVAPDLDDLARGGSIPDECAPGRPSRRVAQRGPTGPRRWWPDEADRRDSRHAPTGSAQS